MISPESLEQQIAAEERPKVRLILFGEPPRFRRRRRPPSRMLLHAAAARHRAAEPRRRPEGRTFFRPMSAAPTTGPAAELPVVAPAGIGPPPAPGAAIPVGPPPAIWYPPGTAPSVSPAPHAHCGPADTYAVPAPFPGVTAHAYMSPIANLVRIGEGVKAYRYKHRTMPPAYLAHKQGKPLLSWRVALLP